MMDEARRKAAANQAIIKAQRLGLSASDEAAIQWLFDALSAAEAHILELEGQRAEMLDWFRKFSMWVPKEARDGEAQAQRRAEDYAGRLQETRKDALALVVPKVGSVWIWEPDLPHVRECVVITTVKWNGEEWWVESENQRDGSRCWNELGRWVEATVLEAVELEAVKQ